MARVLVTGSSGFLGGTVATRLLAARHVVLGLDQAARPPDATYVHVTDDLSDRVRLDAILAETRPTHILHAGGVSGPMVIADQPASIMAINVGGTLNLVQAALAAGVGTFVHCSSISAVGPYDVAGPIGIDQPLRPDTPYGCSKAAVEFILQGLWRRVPMQLCTLRFTGIYGPGRRTSYLLDDIVAAALDGRPVRIPPTSPAPYIHGDDAADAAVAACFATSRSQLAYYVAHPEIVGLDQICDIIAEQIGPVDVQVDETLPAARRGPADLGPTVRDLGFTARIGIVEGLTGLIAVRRAAHQQGARTSCT